MVGVWHWIFPIAHLPGLISTEINWQSYLKVFSSWQLCNSPAGPDAAVFPALRPPTDVETSSFSWKHWLVTTSAWEIVVTCWIFWCAVRTHMPKNPQKYYCFLKAGSLHKTNCEGSSYGVSMRLHWVSQWDDLQWSAMHSRLVDSFPNQMPWCCEGLSHHNQELKQYMIYFDRFKFVEIAWISWKNIEFSLFATGLTSLTVRSPFDST